MAYTSTTHNYLYRVLRRDEQYVESQGITAKHPQANVSVQKHVRHGSNGKSQYISTSASSKAVKKFARLRRDRRKIIAKINCRLLHDVWYVDLTSPYIRYRCCLDERAWNFASKYQEVLIIGYIPPYCIEEVIFVNMYD